ncbi:MAG: translocation/assembly module TamB domain-containing protein [Pseudomonadota bacterium]
MKLLIRIFAVLASVVIIAVLVLAGLSGTGPGLRYTASLISSVISTDDRTIELSELSGVLSGSPKIGRITVADGEGIWLSADGVEADIALGKLVSREVEVNRLTAARLSVSRQPIPGQQDNAGEGGSLPSIPIKIDNIFLPELQLAEPVLGAEALLQLTGSVLLRNEPFDIAGTLDLVRIDGTEGEIASEWTIAPQSRELSLKLDANEPADGLLARALNITGLPALNVSLDGSGPMDNWTASLSMELDGARTVEGNVALSLTDEKQSVDGNLTGFLGPLLPGRITPFFAGDTNIDVSVERDGDGTLLIKTLNARSALLSVNASGGVMADTGTVDISADLEFGAAGNEVSFAVDDNTTLAIGYARISSTLKGSLDEADWALTGTVASLSEGARSVSNLTVSGRSSAIDFRDRSGTATIILQADSVASGQGEIDRLLGGAVRLSADGSFEQTAIEIVQAELKTDAVDLTTRGQLDLAQDEFDLRVEADVEAPQQDILNSLLGSRTARLTGRITQQIAGTLLFTDIEINSDNLVAMGSGQLSEGTLEVASQLSLNDLSALRDGLSGGLKADVRLTGPVAQPNFELEAEGAEISILNEPLEEFTLKASGIAASGIPTVDLDVSGRYEDQLVSVKANVSGGQDGAPVVDALDVSVPGATANGRLVADDAGILTGELDLAVTSFEALGPLLLRDDLAGSLSGSVVFSDNDAKQAITANLTAPRIQSNDIEASDLVVQVEVNDVSDLQGFVASATAATVAVSGTTIENIDGRVSGNREQLPFAVSGRMFDSPLSVEGEVGLQDSATSIRLTKADATIRSIPVQLSEPVSLTLGDSGTRLEQATLSVGAGTVEISGSAGDALDFDVAISAFPIAFFENFADTGLGQTGTLSGTATIAGSASDPDINYDLAVADLSVEARPGVRTPAIAVQSNGAFRTGTLTTDTAITGNGVNAGITGTVNIDTSNSDALDLQVDFRSFPVSLLDNVAPTDLGQTGNLSGTAMVTGALSDPSVSYDLRIADFSIDATRGARMPALSVSSSGAFGSGTLTTQTSASGSGVDFGVNGTIGILDDRRLDLKVEGQAPLELASFTLAESGLQLDGTTQVSIAITGSAANPVINGRLTASDADFIDSNTSLTIREINAAIAFDGTSARIEQLEGRLGRNGTVSAGGSISLNTASGLPADLTISVDDGTYLSEIATARINANLTVEGPLMGSGRIGGSISIERADVTLPDNLPASIPNIEVVHRNAPASVIEQARELAPREDQSSDGSGRGLVLDISVDAPARIFVRGRGIDAEFGGSVTVSGTSNDPRVIGSFSMIRGRIDMLTKRFDFDRGIITFTGPIDPALNFQTTTRSGSSTYSIVVGGTASSPEISFTSSPQLPEDEILANLFFGKNLSKLSAIQIAQLANAVAQVSGAGQRGGFLGRLRGLTGLADIDVNTDNEDGSTTIGIGRYINDRTYFNFEQGLGDGSGRVTIDLDLTDNLKARGEADTDGNTKAGVFFERDY